ncbi:TPA: amidoligase family protein [Clostridioides difficile]|nr:amidoligase family protein [Clostridioides difficile]MBH7250201.1 amidoligase family protein [Clostridioides difficile]MBH7460934.1 amidoligase family protein [Clostridioides difficile]MBY2558198.1 amidoligase family protein [Clostridioides difficile]MCK1917580.1 amidoligase family protein [Clostridioides difficile]
MPRENRYRVNTLNELQEERRRNEEFRNRYLADWTSRNVTRNTQATGHCDRLRNSMNEIFQYIPNQYPVQTNSVQSSKKKLTRKYLNPYYYIPDEFNFNNITNDENLYLGIELEVDRGGKNEENAKFIQEFLGEKNCYIVGDGSLLDGLEIVTHPCTLQYHKKLSYKDLFEELKEKGYKSHDTSTCGYHIHINRDFFSSDLTIQDLCITKILYLIEKYWKYVTVIARRRSNQYSKRFGIKDNESMFELLIKAKGSYVSKYNVVNLQHSKTIEFRMFRGTLKYETFIATMEFVHNLAYICKDTSLEDIQNIEFQDILNVYQTEYLLLYFNNRIENMNNTVDLEDEYKENLRRRIFIRDEWAFLHESSVEQM